MKNHYQELRDRQQEEVNAFPMFFAFDQRQFAEGMRRLGLRPSDMNQVYAIAGTGGFYRKSDAPKLHEMFARHRKELDEAIAADKAGDKVAAYQQNERKQPRTALQNFTGDEEIDNSIGSAALIDHFHQNQNEK